jgi:hypothetical protein
MPHPSERVVMGGITMSVAEQFERLWNLAAERYLDLCGIDANAARRWAHELASRCVAAHQHGPVSGLNNSQAEVVLEFTLAGRTNRWWADHEVCEKPAAFTSVAFQKAMGWEAADRQLGSAFETLGRDLMRLLDECYRFGYESAVPLEQPPTGKPE